ncbi:winged helix-turn-helix domain-containing protein [Shewanella fidelis]|uniref:Helix-turn-helix domain-containing protein n=1 Tax=Shewanella fidelis TaxID=173509 RepID=A0AAW8NH41_9GAMM|nr:helix-turn-helix domain-containing protein [Shewanella fidelis]MDR8522463.1 helix-turn-helix domain-containing protein [Shewanella fidelis]MDW4813003.1 helix-turn-helix domain-containing protein [Shewanella fidelis]MDW4816738.1 helix-turn-helix domain-containing protein [Shewanella fidelis]MDW4821010.1 helix-turn-helix domain-containing protein [Shewanella fidelis]MDW4825455.1 helix-turn-helix domain-containing protein [Shewanella fidelis]
MPYSSSLKLKIIDSSMMLTIEDVATDSATLRKEGEIKLSRSEYLIVKVLLNNHGFPVRRNSLIEAGWPGRYVTGSSLNVVIRSLREKLKKVEPYLNIHTIPSIGYSIELSDKIQYIEEAPTLDEKIEVEYKEVDNSELEANKDICPITKAQCDKMTSCTIIHGCSKSRSYADSFKYDKDRLRIHIYIAMLTLLILSLLIFL